MPQQMLARSAAVATGHPYGTAAGIEILRDGGNAIDAAVAAMIALSVAIPGSVGLGGYGGSAVLFKAGSREQGTEDRNSRVFAIDFDSRAPLGFREGLVTGDPKSNYYGARSVTVPAVVAGLDLLLREFGTMAWSRISQPAIRLAEDGVKFDTEHERYLNRCAPQFAPDSLTSLFSGTALPKPGDCWKQPEMAQLLCRLAGEGPASFYQGEIPRKIVHYLSERGGILDEADFESYRPQMVEAVRSEFRDHALFTPPPPSGGLTSLSIVQTMDQYGCERLQPWTAQYYHVLAEATKLCWHERHSKLGDPAFVDVPIDELLSEPTAASRAQQLRTRKVFRRRVDTDTSTHTANVVSADTEGNLVSLTATQGWMYGSHLVVDGLGLVLNHGMSRFDYSPGNPNSPAPGKRMQHNMSPMIALYQGQPAFAFGLPGGPKIVNVTSQLVLDTIGFGASPADAIAVPRLHTDGDEPIQLSMHTDENIVSELRNLGHSIRREADMGGPVNVLAINPQSREIDIASGEVTGAVAGI
jgi:gamma-glutamyltranspeptidase/glutathione hydrolase